MFPESFAFGMRRMMKRILQTIFIFYVIATIYIVHLLMSSPEEASTPPLDQKTFPEDQSKQQRPASIRVVSNPVLRPHQAQNRTNAKNRTYVYSKNGTIHKDKTNIKTHQFEVWSKIGLGSYTWEHILHGKLDARMEGIWYYGDLQFHNFHFRMRDGDGVQPDKVPNDAENLLLFLNGRSNEVVQYTQYWLDYLPSYQRVKRVILILIGNEQCDNDWVLPYMRSRGGPVHLLFIVYDTHIVNGEDIMQWPLGVATYRGFPLIGISELNLRSARRYRCNFLGTLYTNSSRELLMQVINQNDLDNYCYLKPRQIWQPSESESSLQTYIDVVLQSDLTLCPVGLNAESYRIYEACALGSIPVVEDVTTEGQCSTTPFRLLKKLGAPFIFIKDWRELPQIMEEEKKLSAKEIVARRRRLVAWYETFKYQLKDIFMRKIEEVFEKDVYR